MATCETIYGHVRSTTLQQTTHARLFVAVAALARHAARCLPSIASLINLTLVQFFFFFPQKYKQIRYLCYSINNVEHS